MSLSPAPFLAAPFQAVYLAEKGKVMARYRAAFIPVSNKAAEERAVEFAVHACDLLVKRHCRPVSFGADSVTATEIPPGWAKIEVTDHGVGHHTERVATVSVFANFEVRRVGSEVLLVATPVTSSFDPAGVVHWGHMLSLAANANVNVHDAHGVLQWLAQAANAGHPFAKVWASKVRAFLHDPEAWAEIVIDYFGLGNWQAGSPTTLRPTTPFPRSMEMTVP